MSQTSGRSSPDAADNYYADCIRVLRWELHSNTHCQLQLSQVTSEIRLEIKHPSRFLGGNTALGFCRLKELVFFKTLSLYVFSIKTFTYLFILFINQESCKLT